MGTDEGVWSVRYISQRVRVVSLQQILKAKQQEAHALLAPDGAGDQIMT